MNKLSVYLSPLRFAFTLDGDDFGDIGVDEIDELLVEWTVDGTTYTKYPMSDVDETYLEAKSFLFTYEERQFEVALDGIDDIEAFYEYLDTW